MYEQKHPGTRTKQAIYYVRKLSKPGFDIASRQGKEEVLSYDMVGQEFEYYLRSCLESLFNTDIPFTQTDIPEICAYCGFKQICGR